MGFFELGLIHYLVLAALLFCIGFFGVIVSKHLVRLLLSIELMLNAVNINFVAFSNYNANVEGSIFTIFIMAVAVCEIAVGLAVLIAIYRNTHSINADEQNSLRG